ncbi:uncharacterized protein METZ01_LOCUS283794 [marine metagenome]|uniref:Uncharacterized protein n=1 Tax=marine metagenome TaxID=408172 RepID=A0A382L2J0_9ZZZZ
MSANNTSVVRNLASISDLVNAKLLLAQT